MGTLIRCVKWVIVVVAIGVMLATYFTSKGDDEPTGSVAARESRGFAMPSIPAMITDVDERMEYLALHYWEGFNFSDSLMMHNDSLRGVTMAGYITILERLRDTAVVNVSVSMAFNRCMAAGEDALSTLRTSFEDYLYNPNSPMHNEELYIPVLRHVIESTWVAETDKLRARYQLRMALKNRVGEVATNFHFVTSDGEERSMYSIDSPYTLLFFNNPDCEECGRVKQELATSSHIEALVSGGRLKILAVDAESDMEMWREAEYPPIMINGYDHHHAIMKESLYDLKAMPTLYLLNGSKRVVLKDCSVGVLCRLLH